jgi:hypothetical protein
MQRHILEYTTSIITTLSFAVLYGILEYYWIVTGMYLCITDMDLFSVILEDISWFLCGIISPLPSDTLPGKWIQPSGWTARWSYLTIPGGAVPSWYMIVGLVKVPVWAAVFRHWSKQTLREFGPRLFPKAEQQ